MPNYPYTLCNNKSDIIDTKNGILEIYQLAKIISYKVICDFTVKRMLLRSNCIPAGTRRPKDVATFSF